MLEQEPVPQDAEHDVDEHVELVGVPVQLAAADRLLLGAIQQARVTGSITMISAASARAAMAGVSVLAAVNGAVERMVSPLAAELAPVRVNAVSPGAVDTPWWAFLPEEQRREQFASLAGLVPAARVGEPDDVAGAVAYLASASYVTGTVLAVDGGLTVA